MPSRLGLLQRPRNISTLAALRALDEQELVSQGFLGFTPSVEPSLVAHSGMAAGSFGLLPRGEVLVHEVGWSRVDPTRLPLGDSGAGAAATPAAGANAQPIQHMGVFQRSPVTDNEITVISQDEGGGAENSHVWRLPGTLLWTNVPPRGGYPVGASLPTATAVSYLVNDFIDDAVLSIGVPAGSPYALAAGRGAIVQPVYFFVSANNLVGMYPSFRGGVVNEYDYPIEAAGAVTAFRARSIEAFDGRIGYLNISYSGGTFPQRMWFSVVGDGTNIGVGSIGAGFIDADEMPGVGLRLLRLGDMLAGYFTSGIVLYLKHQPPLAPFHLQYLTTQISVLSGRSVCQIDRDRHFVMADEGWFIIDSTGAITEVGQLRTPTGATMRKWLDYFFANINRQRADNVSCIYNGVQRFVRISFPSRNSNVADTVWYYEPESDRVWPATDYVDQRIQSQIVAPSSISAAATWASMVGSWAVTPGTWLDYAARLGFNVNYHGTRNGFVYIQNEVKGNLRERDDGTNTVPQFSYIAPRVAVGGQGQWAMGRRFEIEHDDVAGGDATLEVQIDARTITASRSMQSHAAGTAGYTYLAVGNVGGTHHGFRVAGPSPISIRRFRYSFVPQYGTKKQYGLP